MSLLPPKSEVCQTFDAFNVMFFNGSLPKIPIHYRRMSWYGHYEDPDPQYPVGLIVLSTMASMDCGWVGCLLHEMIHAFVSLRRGDPDEFESPESPGHGPSFVSECNRIGKVLGFPDITEEDAWSWPEYFDLDYNPIPYYDE